jgi:hypothetical protein
MSCLLIAGGMIIGKITNNVHGESAGRRIL